MPSAATRRASAPLPVTAFCTDPPAPYTRSDLHLLSSHLVLECFPRSKRNEAGVNPCGAVVNHASYGSTNENEPSLGGSPHSPFLPQRPRSERAKTPRKTRGGSARAAGTLSCGQPVPMECVGQSAAVGQEGHRGEAGLRARAAGRASLPSPRCTPGTMRSVHSSSSTDRRCAQSRLGSSPAPAPKNKAPSACRASL